MGYWSLFALESCCFFPATGTIGAISLSVFGGRIGDLGKRGTPSMSQKHARVSMAHQSLNMSIMLRLIATLRRRTAKAEFPERKDKLSTSKQPHFWLYVPL